MFTSGNCRIEMQFTVERQFSHTVIAVQGDDPTHAFYRKFSEAKPWSLSGQLDDGRPILADHLVLNKIGGILGCAEFSPWQI